MIKEKRPDRVCVTFLYCREENFNGFNYTSFAIFFVSCVTGVHERQPLVSVFLVITPPNTFLTKFVLVDVDVIV
jgi:hypothetical protein